MATVVDTTKPAPRWRTILAKIASPWWMGSKPSSGHFVRGLAALVIWGVVGGWLLGTGDRFSALPVRLLVWGVMVIPAWAVLVTAGIMYGAYRPGKEGTS